ncbi:hypothetical protein B0T19DRAFT_82994 [Cercophora scortea]|uniref:Mitochondrial adapter protein MCP1 transmembrane domain-containing protein n=1 Tax=Cercophora scortea TaxID=314031 RepID=A0AAE0J6I9_9PEZI|nr:hypothetical protein B0T19DRAFT_82994 [Cercophora scortea]
MDSQTLHTKASQDTLVSLLQLDPLPIDSPPLVRSYPSLDAIDTDKDLPPLPDALDSPNASSSSSTPSHSRSTSGIGLSGTGGHGAIYYLTRIQRYSSYTFSVFASLHLVTTSIIPFVARSVPASESYLLLAREIYQTTLSEPLLVCLPIVAHVGSGIALRLLRRAHNVRRYYGDDHGGHKHSEKKTLSIRNAWPSVSYIAISGYGFAVAVAAHVFVNRALPLLVEGDSANIGLAYVAHGFARHPLVSWVSYGALLGLGCGHMVWGWAKWFGIAQRAGWKLERHTGNAAVDRQVKKRRRRMLLGINAVAAAGVVAWAAGGLGVVAKGGLTLGWVGKLYDGLYEKIPGL